MSVAITVAYHGHCFDGMASAAVLTRFLREHEFPGASWRYRGLDHQPGGSFVPDDALDGDVNAVVDFRYTTSPRLTWFFDHHVSGVTSEAERAHLQADTSGRKFFDPTYGSCCKLIADVVAERFGARLDALDELIRWADVIDAARFESAEQAVALKAPALQLMTVLEAHGDDAFVAPRVEQLSRGVPLGEVAAHEDVRRLFAPLAARHRRVIDEVRRAARCEEGVVFFDLVGSGQERYNKFVPYWLFPQALYSVAVTQGPGRAKVSVGFNPWAEQPREHNIAELCARYGGGGHPVVGAVSFPAGEVARARQAAQEIAAVLRESS